MLNNGDKSADEVMREVLEARRRASVEAAAAAAAKKAEEKQARKARQDAMKAKWEAPK